MQFRFTIIETSLNRAEFRWKWLRFLQHTFTLGVVLCLIGLALALAIVGGWITNKTLAITIVTILAILGALAWIVIVIAILAGTTERNWLASAIERIDPRLLDRLNTLLFLERRPREPKTDAFSVRIAKQTQAVLNAKPSPPPFPGSRPLPYLFAFLIAVTATYLVCHIYSPWSRLVAPTKLSKAQPPPDRQPLELSPPSTNNLEQNQNWGEVRITDPGTDLKVTKVDVVPLQIEAAANQALKKVGWYSTINGTGETNHDLPPPTEPRYALYQPTIYLDELRLSDWDVMTYYAKANTEKDNSFASEVYFLEVRPFREDILKLPGGENGEAYQTLAEMSALINRQQHIIRQTHQHIQKPPEQENLRVQDRMKLSDAEGDMRESADHLYAKMAAEMENKPIGEALDNLAKGGKSLNQASTSLRNNVMNEAPMQERNALSELIAARKIFQKAVSDNPGAFEDSKGEEEQSPVADASKKLNQMAEFRNESKAAQQFVQKAIEQQRNLERRARNQSRANSSKLAAEERELEKSLGDFKEQHPQPFNGTDSESKAAQDAMSKAAEAMEKKTADAGKATQQASEELEKLGQAMIAHSATQQLADAYKLKQMLDQQSKTLGQYAEGTNNIPDSDLQKTAGAAQETLNQLKHVAEQEPTRDAFGEPLRSALSGTNKVDLDAKLNQLQMASGEAAAKRQQAGEARDGLDKVSKAFGASEPGAMQMARKSDPLKPGDQDAFGLGMNELESLIKQLERPNQIPQNDQSKQGQEALFNLQLGLRDQYGNNDRGNQILLSLEQVMKTNILDVDDLKKLMDQLQHFSVETSDHLAKKDDKPDVTNIDPMRLPPAYRGRIQKYFQKLSEK
jgi:hypothetical protein